MSRDEKRRQKSLTRKAAKRKKKKHTLVRLALPSGARAQIKAAAQWPLHECLITREWDTPGELVQILVARSSPEGEIGASVFLVDLACLGVKDAFTRYFPTYREYEALRQGLKDWQSMVRGDLDLAAKIIREAIDYAGALGFSPHRDYYDAAILLEGASPDACASTIPLGVDGKPFFVSGPYDNVPRIMAHLEKAVGPGNFEFVARLGGPGDFLTDEE